MAPKEASNRSQNEKLAKARDENVGRLLVLAFRRFEEIIVERLRYHGFTDIRLIHASLMREIDTNGSRLTEISRQLGMHKQAVGQLATEFEKIGYIRRVPDPRDGRAWLIKFTTKGTAILKVLPQIHREAYEELEKLIGKNGIVQLSQLLRPIAEVQRLRERAMIFESENGHGGPVDMSARGKKRGRKSKDVPAPDRNKVDHESVV